jgi:hypothetical protein
LIVAVSLSSGVALAMEGLRANSIFAMGVLLLTALLGLGIALGAAVGGWWCGTLRYRLGTSALDVLCGVSRLRIRYEQIERVATVPQAIAADAPLAWPGFYVGRIVGADGDEWCWRATTNDVAALVFVEVAGTQVVVSPDDPEAFRGAVVRAATETSFVRAGRVRPPVSLLDVLGHSPWTVRLMLLLGFVILGAVCAAELAGMHPLPMNGVAAAAGVLLVNTVISLALGRRVVRVAHVLAGTALFCQLIVLLLPVALVVQ